MRVSGRELRTAEPQRVSLVRGDGTTLSFQVRPLPLGFHRRLRSLGIIPPQPPVRIAREPGGTPLRDSQGHAVTIRDENDPAHAAAVECYHQRVAVLAIVESLRADPDIEWETPRPAEGATEPATWTTYADSLLAELERAGFTAGDLSQLCGCVCRMSRLLDEHLREARGNFSPAEASTA